MPLNENNDFTGFIIYPVAVLNMSPAYKHGVIIARDGNHNIEMRLLQSRQCGIISHKMLVNEQPKVCSNYPTHGVGAKCQQ